MTTDSRTCPMCFLTGFSRMYPDGKLRMVMPCNCAREAEREDPRATCLASWRRPGTVMPILSETLIAQLAQQTAEEICGADDEKCRHYPYKIERVIETLDPEGFCRIGF